MAGSDEAPPLRLVEVDDERDEVARDALGLIRDAFPPRERQPLDQIEMEIAEKRLGLLTSYDFHLFAGVSDESTVTAISAGVYLGGVNAGMVTYLAVVPQERGAGTGRRLRVRLQDAFRADARRDGWSDLQWMVGEVRFENPWLQRLVRERGAIPLDLTYYHPGVGPRSGERWVLYRQPVGDARVEIPAGEVRRLVYAIWRRAYRVRWPLAEEGFTAMLEELEGRSVVGAHPEVSAE